ncbi:signal recognition particle-docking protein FtsY [Peptoniphilus duerdenii ATCC BAA-1640]|uniref:Signal recognition particle receptor FtsY n=1 Tax=Peptoniphilus duerdenii ATCC BAA-1640 TaxID=862517 RepID=E0NMR4_9FIRM|nr:signal recognition particle-docking protein FtsY [Peptoniphilus duerdenii]EFM24882.1 signal recognition particle-docking protein FtsY [Peptoniphilus duerdenii ATCC BAA-1640]
MLNWFKDKFKKEKENIEEENLENIIVNEEFKDEIDDSLLNEDLQEISQNNNCNCCDHDDSTYNCYDNSNNDGNDYDNDNSGLENLDEEYNETSIEINNGEDLVNEEPEKEFQIEKDFIEESLENSEPEKIGFFAKLKKGLDKTRKDMSVKFNTIIGAYVKIDDEMLEDLEDILISADVGMETTMKLVDNLRESIIENKVNDPNMVVPLLKEETLKLMDIDKSSELNLGDKSIILVVGVNGVGKTTTIGKLANRFRKEGKSVLVAAGDTFRAAAIEQLKEWGNRANIDVIHQNEGSDPAAVIFDAIEAAKSRNIDVLICDTAGRLHNKQNLMKELEKISNVIETKYPEATRETLLVLDATTGQNAINQAKTFKEAANITGMVLTKLDGTAKGGVVLALQSELGVPIKLVGVGEGIDDLQNFNSKDFVEALFEE